MIFEDQIAIIPKISILFFQTALSFYANLNPTLIIIEDVIPQQIEFARDFAKPEPQ